jgi:hypothetical protein
MDSPTRWHPVRGRGMLTVGQLSIDRTTGGVSMDRKAVIEQLGQDAFTSEPSGDRALKFVTCFRAHMLNHLTQAVKSAEEGLKVDLGPLRKRVEALDPNTPLAPTAFTGLTMLSQALASGNVTRVVDAVQALRTTSDAEWTDAQFRVESILTERWEEGFVASARGETVEGRDPDERIMRPVLDPDPGPRFRAVDEALGVLTQVDPPLAAEFHEVVTRVKLFAGRGYLGLSSPAAFGAVYIRLPDTDPLPYFLEHLVHEQSHLYLNTMMALDPLLVNPGEPAAAPLRPDPRPMFQVLHATFVLGRNVRLGRRLLADPARSAFGASVEELEEKYAEGHATLSGSATFTDLGKQVFESLEEPRG